LRSEAAFYAWKVLAALRIGEFRRAITTLERTISN
jgi:hypothetical protein